jgi:hypothetical protein
MFHCSTSQRPLLLKSRHWLVEPVKIPLKLTMVNIVACNLAYYDILCFEFPRFCFGFFSSIILWEFSVCFGIYKELYTSNSFSTSTPLSQFQRASSGFGHFNINNWNIIAVPFCRARWCPSKKYHDVRRDFHLVPEMPLLPRGSYVSLELWPNGLIH